MPNHCSAPGCKSNYRGEPYTPAFKLPTAPQELRTQWMHSIMNALHHDKVQPNYNTYLANPSHPTPLPTYQTRSRQPICHTHLTEPTYRAL